REKHNEKGGDGGGGVSSWREKGEGWQAYAGPQSSLTKQSALTPPSGAGSAVLVGNPNPGFGLGTGRGAARATRAVATRTATKRIGFMIEAFLVESSSAET
ncbi:10482_t:CDS:2, partial [Acaulospora colombiana]